MTLTTVVFLIGDQRYALPIAEVREIVRLPSLVTLAGAPPAVCGLLNLRGAYLPVIEGRRLVGAPPHVTLDSQIVVAGDDAAALGLLVDQVIDVRSYAQEACAPLARRGAEAFLRAVLRGEDGAALLMGLPELRALAPAVDHVAA